MAARCLAVRCHRRIAPGSGLPAADGTGGTLLPRSFRPPANRGPRGGDDDRIWPSQGIHTPLLFEEFRMRAFPSPTPRHPSAAASRALPAGLGAVAARDGFSWG
ncbi:hypothetical protein GCM10027028_03430 [Streptomyces sundarbansensis]